MSEISQEQINQLRELAQKATPGPWEWDELDGTIEKRTDGKFDSIIIEPVLDNDSAFIAAANPSVVLALVARLEKLEKEADWLAERLGMEEICTYSGEDHECPGGECKDCWREAAREAVEATND